MNSVKKGVLKNLANFTGKHLRRSLYFNEYTCLRPANLSKKETLTQVFSCEFCEQLLLNFIKEEKASKMKFLIDGFTSFEASYTNHIAY